MFKIFVRFMLKEKLVQLLDKSFGLQLKDGGVEVRLGSATEHREHVADVHVDLVVLRPTGCKSRQNASKVAVINL